MADVTVMGAGVFGLSVAWACARRGARVRVADPGGVGAGASGGLVGALAPHVPERWDAVKAVQFDALVMAGEWWAAVAAAGGVDPGHDRIGRVQPLGGDAAVARARARAASAAALWAGVARWEVVPAAEAPGPAVASPSGLVVHDTLSGRLNPRAACRALAAAVTSAGGEVATSVAGAGRAGAGGSGAVVWATGAAGLTDAGLGAGVKGQALLLDLALPGAPLVMAPGLFVVPHADGTVAVGSTSEDGWTDPRTTDGQLEAVLARARALCPVLEGARVLERWAGLRPRARGGRPLLGPWPGRPGHYLANGGFRIGFALAPLAGERLAELILEGCDRLPEAFRPDPRDFPANVRIV